VNRPWAPARRLKVDDVRGVVERIREAGWDTVGEIATTRTSFSSATVAALKVSSFELAERI